MQSATAHSKTDVTARHHVIIRRVTSAKSLKPEQQERVREGLRLVIKAEGSQKKAARVLEVSQQTVNGCASGTTEPGVTLATKVARAIGQSFEELVDGAPVNRPAVCRDLPGWEAAADEVIAMGAQRRGVVRRAGGLLAPLRPDRVGPRFVLDMCTIWLSHAPLSERLAVETDEAREDMTRAGH